MDKGKELNQRKKTDKETFVSKSASRVWLLFNLFKIEEIIHVRNI